MRGRDRRRLPHLRTPPRPPALVASTLLAFHPRFLFGDLPTTSRREALAAAEAARGAGLRRVRTGSIHLLQDGA